MQPRRAKVWASHWAQVLERPVQLWNSSGETIGPDGAFLVETAGGLLENFEGMSRRPAAGGQGDTRCEEEEQVAGLGLLHQELFLLACPR